MASAAENDKNSPAEESWDDWSEESLNAEVTGKKTPANTPAKPAAGSAPAATPQSGGDGEENWFNDLFDSGAPAPAAPDPSASRDNWPQPLFLQNQPAAAFDPAAQAAAPADTPFDAAAEETGGKRGKGKKGAKAPKAAGSGGKKLPKPLLIGLGVLVLAGAGYGGFTLMNPSEPEEEFAAPVSLRPRKPKPPKAETPADAAKPAPGKPTGGKPAAPGKPVAPVKPAAVAAAGMKPLTPELEAKLKALWKKGAKAKRVDKDNAAARKAWQEILKLRPGHPGIQEAIDKLPRA